MQGLSAVGSGGISSAIGAGMNIAGGFAGYRAANANAAYADANAQSALVDGATASTNSNNQYRAAIGNQIAAQGASGFQMGTGSALDALNQSRINEASAAMSINRQASIRAQIYHAQAQQDRASGTQALLSGILKGASGVINQRMDYANADASMGFGGPTSKAGALTAAPRGPAVADFGNG